MPKVVVIGGNGFLGSHVVDALVRHGHEVSAFDRFGTREASFTSKDVRSIRGDFLNRKDLDNAVRGQNYVFHFLSTTSPATAESNPTLDVQTNVVQSLELLKACVEAGIERFFFASTGGAVYGPQGKPRYDESDQTLPVSPYAIGKLTIENYLNYFAVMHGLDSTTLRISNPFGPRQRANNRQGLIPIALRRICLGLPVERFGDGSMVRDYVYVEDIVAMIMRMVDSSVRFNVYNLGSGQGHSVSDILNSLRRVTNVDFDVVDRLVPPTFVDRVVLDVSRYLAEFGAFEFTPLDEGISRTYEEIRGQSEQ